MLICTAFSSVYQLRTSLLACSETIREQRFSYMNDVGQLASSIRITLKGVVFPGVSYRFSSVGSTLLPKYLPGFIMSRCVANSVIPGAAAHHSHLIMLARRRARTVSSQQHDLIHGLCDNNTTAVLPLKTERALQGKNDTYRCTTASNLSPY